MKSLFWNKGERRLRAIWRILLTPTALTVAITGSGPFFPLVLWRNFRLRLLRFGHLGVSHRPARSMGLWQYFPLPIRLCRGLLLIPNRTRGQRAGLLDSE